MGALAKKDIKVSFTPHLIPQNRGILTTAYVDTGASTDELAALYNDFYLDKPFVVILEKGQQPNTKNVFGTNYCHIAVTLDQRTGRAIITSAIDNMGKGAAGQAVQNMNLMCDFEQTTGLMLPAVYP